MGSVTLAVDHDRGILYVNDAEEPEGIMAFSLSTGERIRVLPGAGRRWPARILPGCSAGGPAARTRASAPMSSIAHVLMARDREESSAISDRIWSARIACTDDAAYVAMELPRGSGYRVRVPPQR